MNYIYIMVYLHFYFCAVFLVLPSSFIACPNYPKVEWNRLQIEPIWSFLKDNIHNFLVVHHTKMNFGKVYATYSALYHHQKICKIQKMTETDICRLDAETNMNWTPELRHSHWKSPKSSKLSFIIWTCWIFKWQSSCKRLTRASRTFLWKLEKTDWIVTGEGWTEKVDRKVGQI